MLPAELTALEFLTTPVWVVEPTNETLIFANQAALNVMGALTLTEMRGGAVSACAQARLSLYIADLGTTNEIVEIWTVNGDDGEVPLRCRLTLATLPSLGSVILFEGANIAPPASLKASRSVAYKSRKQGFYTRFFMTTTAPMLLIDPARDGLIVDANLAALRFYGYSSEEICQKHTWEINTLGRQVLPVMSEIARLPGGHKPLNFLHRLADGSTRHVQTYAGPVEIYGDRLMLCIVHDITEQKRLEQELEFAAQRDPLTGLLNRRQFYTFTEQSAFSQLPVSEDYSLLLIDTDNFKLVNDVYGHLTGDEVLVQLARTLESCCRKEDYVFRWGGEEFVMLLPRTTLDKAVTLAETIRAAVMHIGEHGLPSITVSIGVTRHQPGESVDSLFRRVDAALYQAKNAGRNKVLAA
ncbi:MAG: sensor domain-containing diguanylate cyclase [Yokenella regensburgei]|jgi:diguanylate cyclase (GGDEF)-like protein/PAS domain S-box-containing protein|uniref:diguanylate cyclase n=1 Tax=Yokenella regensburgei TaxID=158877 RepID=UPI00284D5E5B|nr:sensor domain-containing diguanylate cyclase [Yokenella regensburgei]